MATSKGVLTPFTIDPEVTPTVVVRPRPHSWTFIERDGVLDNRQGLGSHAELEAAATLNSNNLPTVDAKGNYVWFKYQSTTTLGDGVVKIRGRLKDDEGTREATPTTFTFDMTGATPGEVFVAPSRMADNCGILVTMSGGFDGVIDYGTVSPWSAGGGMETLFGAEFEFEPIPQVTPVWRVSWEIQGWRPGVGGGLFDIIQKRTYRQNDTPFKAAASGQPGHDHKYNIDQAFDARSGTQGIVFGVALKAMAAGLTLYI